jgi:DNA-binding NarL/FixJ family response regulator
VPVRILIADDHPVVRLGLRALLQAQPDFQLVGEAEGGVEALRLCERLRPDVLVLDLMMPDMTGLEVIRQVRRLPGRVRVVVLSTYSDESYVTEALRNGAMGYVLKTALQPELVQAVRHAAADRHFLSAGLPQITLGAFLDEVDAAVSDPFESLTAREREVVRLAAMGRTTREISATLHIGERTVETHRARAMNKLGLHSQVELARYAIRRRMVPAQE